MFSRLSLQVYISKQLRKLLLLTLESLRNVAWGWCRIGYVRKRLKKTFAKDGESPVHFCVVPPEGSTTASMNKGMYGGITEASFLLIWVNIIPILCSTRPLLRVPSCYLRVIISGGCSVSAWKKLTSHETTSEGQHAAQPRTICWTFCPCHAILLLVQRQEILHDFFFFLMLSTSKLIVCRKIYFVTKVI